jgi:DNA-directed RNA polymerase specialized sigma24 family protein
VDDDAVFAGFVHANSGALFKTAFLLTGSADKAEELLQDTLARLYAKWEKVAAADNPPAYVRRALASIFHASGVERRCGCGSPGGVDFVIGV